MLYPIKFRPILKETIWGGERLSREGKPLRKSQDASRIGESWEISTLPGNLSVASNGFLKSNDLEELIEVYMGDLVGDKVYEEYGEEFPLLIKFIDAREKLSVQVHPNDDLAADRNEGRGKTEMWYIMDAAPGSVVYVGFNREVSAEDYMKAASDGTIPSLLQTYEARKGDIFYIPAGTLHAIGEGIILAEIQEASDITYRVDDWGRVGKNGKPRRLHLAEALDAIDFSYGRDYLKTVSRQSNINTLREAVSSPYFTTNLIQLDGEMLRDHESLDSFVVYICTEGHAAISTNGGNETLDAFQCLLIPAEADEVRLQGKATLLEVFIR